VSPFYAASQAFVRARLSRLLDRETWLLLLASQTSAELVRVLRDTWVEPAVTADARIVLRTLRGEVAAAADTLGRFLPRRSKQLLAWYNRRFEIENLKIVLRSIHYRVDRQRARASLIPLRSSRWPWQTLLDAGSVPELADQLRGSPYARPLEQAFERYQQEQRLFYLEIAVDLFYFQRLVQWIESQRGTEQADALSFLGQWVAIQNLTWAYRYRIYGRMSPEEILNFTLHRAFAANLDAVRRVALGAPLEAEAQRLGFRLSPGLSEVDALTELEVLAERERYRRAAAAFSRPLFRLGGVLAYLALLESEIRDLGVVVEGKATGLTGADIKGRLLRAT